MEHADANWFAVFKNMFVSGTAAAIGPSAWILYCAIKAHADFHNGTSVPSQKELAEQTGLSERQIPKSLKVLEEHGLLEKKREWKKNVYRVRERIILDNAVVATWDYLPSGLQQALQELQNFLLTGDTKDAKIIHIEKLVINVVAGDQVNIVQELDVSEIKYERLRGLVEKLRTTLSNRETLHLKKCKDLPPS
jgi:DNA-binding transcriptional regulator YhcF (GntR family)